jgi:uncharacterized protein (DUF1778 family)
MSEERTSRLDLRLTPTEKAQLKAAAELTGKTVTAFLIDHSIDAATAAIHRAERFAAKRAA